MGEIKSAWEIAMEKAEKLEELSPEELRKRKEEKYALIGQTLTDKFLGGLDLWQLEVELDKYAGEERALLKRAMETKLASSIEPGDYERLSRATECISYLKQTEETEKIHDEIKQLFREYEQFEQKEKEERSVSAGEILHRFGISGSAIESVNPSVTAGGKQSSNGIAQPYRERLELLKQKLINLPSK